MQLAHEDLYDGAPVAHIAAYYDKLRLERIRRDMLVAVDRRVVGHRPQVGRRRLLRIVS